MSTTVEKLAALKEKLDTSIVSSDTTPFPLAAFLLLYTKAHEECYIEYMEGARILYKWLGPIDIPPDMWNNKVRAPKLLRSYETRELAKILADDLFAANITEQCIIKTLMQEYLNGFRTVTN